MFKGFRSGSKQIYPTLFRPRVREVKRKKLLIILSKQRKFHRGGLKVFGGDETLSLVSFLVEVGEGHLRGTGMVMRLQEKYSLGIRGSQVRTDTGCWKNHAFHHF